MEEKKTKSTKRGFAKRTLALLLAVAMVATSDMGTIQTVFARDETTVDTSQTATTSVENLTEGSSSDTQRDTENATDAADETQGNDSQETDGQSIEETPEAGASAVEKPVTATPAEEVVEEPQVRAAIDWTQDQESLTLTVEQASYSTLDADGNVVETIVKSVDNKLDLTKIDLTKMQGLQLSLGFDFIKSMTERGLQNKDVFVYTIASDYFTLENTTEPVAVTTSDRDLYRKDDPTANDNNHVLGTYTIENNVITVTLNSEEDFGSLEQMFGVISVPVTLKSESLSADSNVVATIVLQGDVNSEDVASINKEEIVLPMAATPEVTEVPVEKGEDTTDVVEDMITDGEAVTDDNEKIVDSQNVTQSNNTEATTEENKEEKGFFANIKSFFASTFGLEKESTGKDVTKDTTQLELTIPWMKVNSTNLEKDDKGNYVFPENVTPLDVKNMSMELDFALKASLANRTITGGDYFTFDLPNAILTAPKPETNLYLADGTTIIGTYTISNETAQDGSTFGRVHVILSDEVNKDNWTDNIKGGFQIEFMLDQSKLKNGEETDLDIELQNPDSATHIIIPPIPTKVDGVTKTGILNPEDNSITWTVGIGTNTEKVSLNDIAIADDFDNNQEFISGSAKIVDVNGNKIFGINDTQLNLSGYSFKYTFKDTNDTTYTAPQYIQYKTYLTEAAIITSEPVNASNKATIKDESKETNRVGSNYEKTANVNVPKNVISKSGTQITSNLLGWTIDLNDTEDAPRTWMYKAVITDELEEGLTYKADTLKVTGEDRKELPLTVYADSDDHDLPYASTSIVNGKQTLKIHMPETVKQKYEIYFETSVDPGAFPQENPEKPVTVTNTATLDVQYPQGGEEPGSEVHWGIGPIGSDFNTAYITKTVGEVDLQTGVINWKIEPSTRTDEFNQAVITDIIEADQELIPSSVQIQVGDKILSSTDNTEDFAKVYQWNETQKQMTFTFKKTDYNSINDIVITYRSKALNYFSENNIDHLYRNEANLEVTQGTTVYKDSDEDTATFKNPYVQKTTDYVFDDTSNKGYFHYAVIVNENKLSLTNLKIEDDLAAATFTYKDIDGTEKTISSDNFELAKIGTGAYDCKLVDSTTGDTITDKVSITDKTIKAEITGTTSDTYVLHIYYTLTKDNKALLGDVLAGKTLISENTASATSKEMNNNGPLTATSKGNGGTDSIQNDLLSKDGAKSTVQGEENIIKWTVKINSNAAPLKDASVIDTIPKGLKFDRASLHLYKATHNVNGVLGQGGEVTNYKVVYEPDSSGSTKASVELPADSYGISAQAYILTFNTIIVGNIENALVQNTAQLSYDGHEENSNQENVEVDNGAWAQGNTIVLFEFNKYDDLSTDNVLIPVAGAAYGLYTDSNCDEKSLVDVGYSDENGKVQLIGSKNTIYYIKEISAATQYELDDKIYTIASQSKGGRVQLLDSGVITNPTNVSRIVDKRTIKETGNAEIKKSYQNGEETITVNEAGTALASNFKLYIYPKGQAVGFKQEVELTESDGIYTYKGVGTATKMTTIVANASENGGKLFLNSLPWGDYGLEEVSQAEGSEAFAVDSTMQYFTVSAEGTTYHFGTNEAKNDGTILNKETHITINKYQTNTTTRLEGANLIIYDSTGKTVEKNPITGDEYKWTSTSNSAWDVYDLPAGSYILREEKNTSVGTITLAADIKFTIDANGKLTAGGSENIINMYDDPVQLTVQKRDQFDKVVVGAKVKVENASDTTTYSSEQETTKENAGNLTFTDLERGGTYTITEKTTPDGYVVARTITVKMKDDGTGFETVNLNNEDDAPDQYQNIGAVNSKTVLLRDERIVGHASLLKRDNNDRALSGVKFDLYKVTDGAEDTKVNPDNEHFTTDTNGQITTVDSKLINQLTKTQFGDETIGNGLGVGSYYFKEVSSNSYFQTPTTDELAKTDTFEIKADNRYTWKSPSTGVEINNVIVVTDTVDSTNNTFMTNTALNCSIKFTKYEQGKDGNATTTPVGGATYKLTGTTDDNESYEATAKTATIASTGNKYTDAAGVDQTYALAVGEAYFGNVPKGTYSLIEVTPAEGYVMPSNTTILSGIVVGNNDLNVVKDLTENENNVKQILDRQSVLTIEKADADGTTQLAGATLRVTPADIDGKFAISSEDSIEWTTENGSLTKEILGELIAGQNYTLHEVTPPKGYATSAEITFKIDANGGNVKIVGSASNAKVTNMPDSATHTLTMLDEVTSITLKKVDQDGKDATGASFTITPEDGYTFQDGSTYTINWNSGEKLSAILVANNVYKVVETSKATGCVPVSNPDPYVIFRVKYNGAIEITDQSGPKDNFEATVVDGGKTLRIKNTRIYGSVKLTKSSSDPLEDVKVSGAVFKLYRYTGTEPNPNDQTTDTQVGEENGYTTDEKGEISITQSKKVLTEGKYYFLETKAPYGYIDTTATKTPCEFEISATNYTVEQEIYASNTPIDFKLQKTNETANNISKVTKYHISATKGTGNDRYFADGTDAESRDYDSADAGLLNLHSVLITGNSYVITESQAPSGYVTPANKSFEFTVEAAGTIKVTGNTLGVKAGTDVIANNTTSVAMTELMLPNTETQVSFKKVGDQTDTANGLVGATLALYTYTNKTKGTTNLLANKWTTTNDSCTYIGLPEGDYVLEETSRAPGYAFSAPIYFTLGAGNVITLKDANGATTGTINGTVTDKIITMTDKKVLGTVNFTKTFGTANTPVNGAQFGLYLKTGSEYATATNITASSGNDGKVSFTNVPEGTYGIKEISVPDAVHKSSDVLKNVTVTVDVSTADGKLNAIPTYNLDSINNDAMSAKVTLFKYDGDSGKTAVQSGISGTQFTLERQTGTNPESWSVYNVGSATEGKYTTANDGTLTLDGLIKGNYRLTETASATGYVLPGDAFSCTFTIVNEDQGETYAISTGTAGTATDKKFQITSGSSYLTADGLKNTRKTGTLEIVKKSENTESALDGVTFKMYKKSDGSWIENAWNFITGNQYEYLSTTKQVTTGKTKITGLTWGDYYIVETATIDGYKVTSNKYYFTVNATTSETAIAIYSNEEMTTAQTGNIILNAMNTLSIVKKNADKSTTLADAVFTVTKQNTNDEYVDVTGFGQMSAGTAVADADSTLAGFQIKSGTAVMALRAIPAGTYKLTEVVAPTGYAIGNDVVFTMSDTGEVTVTTGQNVSYADKTMTITDAPLEVSVKKTGKNSVTQKNVKFKVTNTEGADIVGNSSLSTNDQGIITIDTSAMTYNTTYKLVEVTPYAGYKIVEPITFKFGTDGSVTYGESNTKASDNVIPVSNTENSFELTKTLSGGSTTAKKNAEFELYVENNTIPTWSGTTDESTGKITVTGQMIAGTVYRLHEKSAPAGYELAADTYYLMDTSGNLYKMNGYDDTAYTDEKKVSNNKVTVSDTAIAFNIIKIDKDGAAVSGAKFSVAGTFATKESPVTVDLADADTMSKLTGEFVAGQEYILTETTTPYGYLSIPGAIKFKIGTDGKLSEITQNQYYPDNTIEAQKTAVAAISPDGLTLSITNLKIAGHVKLNKKDSGNTPISGVYFNLYKVKVAAEENDTLIAENLTTDVNGIWTSVGSTTVRKDITTKTLGEGLEQGSYYFKETKTKDQYYTVDSQEYTFDITADDDYATNGNVVKAGNIINVTNTAFTASLDLEKLDATNGSTIADTIGESEDYAGAEFTLVKTSAYDATQTTYVLRTNANGKAYVYKEGSTLTGNSTTPVALTKGSYVLTETMAPTGYEAKNSVDFSCLFTVTDAENGKTLIIKKDNLSTDANVKAFNLRADDAVVTAFLTSKEDTPTYKGVYNQRELTSVQLTKQDEDQAATKLNHAEFKLEKIVEPANPAEWLSQLVTGKKYDVIADKLNPQDNTIGLLTINNLDYGTYKLTETKSPDGYKLTNASNVTPSITFTIDRTNAGQTVTLTYDNDGLAETPEDAFVSNKQTSITIEKTIFGTNTKLGGANLKLTGKFADPQETEITWNTSDADANPKTITGKLIVGETYTLAETNRVSGYESLVDKSVTFHLDNQGNIVIDTNTPIKDEGSLAVTDENAAVSTGNALTLRNLPINGKVVLTKTDKDTTTAMKDMTFNLYKTSDRSKVNEELLVTDEDGKITVGNLAEGDYYFVETSKPNGYLINTTEYTFHIGYVEETKDGKTVEVYKPDTTVSPTNEPLKVNIEFFKYYENTFTSTSQDSLKQTGIAGATFKLEYATEKDGAYTPVSNDPIVTDVNGKGSYNGLKRGWYKLTEMKADGYEIAGSDGKAFSCRFEVTDADQSKTIILNSERATALTNQTALTVDGIKNIPITTSLPITKTDVVTGNGISPVTFTLGGMTYYQEKFTQSQTSNEEGKLNFTEIPVGTYKLTESAKPDDYKIPVNVYDVIVTQNDNNDAVLEMKLDNTVISKDETSGSYVITNEQKYADISFTKYGTNNETNLSSKTPLGGAIFGLYTDEGCTTKATSVNGAVVENETSQSDGMVTFHHIYVGTYYIKEESAPKNYSVDGTIYRAVINNTEEGTFDGIYPIGENTSKTEEIIDEAVRGSISLTKVDSSDAAKKLSGVTFSIYRPGETESFATATTNEEGIATFNNLLMDVAYTVKETATLQTYVLSATEETRILTDTESGRNINLGNWINDPTSFSFKKVQTTGDVLPGAIFGLYDGEKQIQTALSDANGIVTFTYFEKDKTYTVKEEAAPEGYFKNETTFQLVVDAGGKGTLKNQGATITEVVNDDIGSITLNKTDAVDGTKLAGATFTLENKAGEVVDTQTTDAEGELVFEELPMGDYTITETKSPEGYLDSSDVTKVTLTKGATTQNVTISRTNQKADFSFNKTIKYFEDCYNIGTTTALAGATFTLYAEEDCKTEVATAISDASGVVSYSHIATGTYYLKETAVPTTVTNTITLDTTVREVVVKGDGSVTINGTNASETTVVNDVVRGQIAIKKVNEDDHDQAIANSTYGLYRAISDEAVEEKTVGTGQAGKSLGTLSTFSLDEQVTTGLSLMSDGATTFEIGSIRDGMVLVATATTDADGMLKFDGVLTGVKYVIRELVAPSGSEVSDKPIEIEFTMKEQADGNMKAEISKFDDGSGTAKVDPVTGEITWYEPDTKAMFYKKDEDGKLLAGAKMTITNEDGTPVDGIEEWTSSATEGHMIQGILVGGKTYILKEISAPDGYEVAESITFTMSTKSVGPNENYVQEWTMVDKKLPAAPADNEDKKTTTGTQSTTAATERATTTAAETGDTSPLIPWSLGLVAALLVILGVEKKKKENQ